nr:six-bladed beta-propeller, TolB-like protein [Tanacetum cinerariifolium]
NITQPGFTPDSTGRLLKYDPYNQTVTVLLSGLSGVGGPTANIHRDCILVPESVNKTIIRYWLEGPKVGTTEETVCFITYNHIAYKTLACEKTRCSRAYGPNHDQVVKSNSHAAETLGFFQVKTRHQETKIRLRFRLSMVLWSSTLVMHYRTSDIYITDAFFGLLVVGFSGGLATQLSTGYKYLSGIDVESYSRHVYMTDASLTYDIRVWEHDYYCGPGEKQCTICGFESR